MREGSNFDWVKTHTFRKTVATILDEGGASDRMIADQLGHSRVSMTQDVYIGRKVQNAGNVTALEAANLIASRAPKTAIRPLGRSGSEQQSDESGAG